MGPRREQGRDRGGLPRQRRGGVEWDRGVAAQRAERVADGARGDRYVERGGERERGVGSFFSVVVVGD